ncbi:resuscitation-promoting factor [Schaalia suimastitidis]|uniref:resuscitation-promoting factor n=1 Tax=Schaalia suimastitidis TaxID=121163 RepID=UPI0004079697|nr:resuscitation-promoting factor [Schaalia suimastitidis]
MNLRRPTRRTVLTASAASAAAIIAIASAGAIAAHREVVVEVDGVSVPVTGFFSDVQGALSTAGINLGQHDQVAPALAETVSDGDTVVVRSASEYSMTIDGENVSAWSTATNISDVIGDVLADGATVAMPADRSTERAQLPLQATSEGIVVNADGQSVIVNVEPTATTDEILAAAGVTASPIDQVSFTREGQTLTVNVTRVMRGTVVETEELAFTTEERQDDTLTVGTTKVLQEGANGSVNRTYYRQSVNGVNTVDVLVSEERTEPVNKIVAVGTKAATTTSSTSTTTSSTTVASGDVWAALARCESGGNPTTNTGNGYYGMYQFSLPTWRSVGGTGLPSEASAEEQTMRAQILQARSGWGQWPACAAKLGLL